MKYAVIDIETTGLSRFKHSITFIGVGLAEDIGEPISKMFIYDVGYDEDVKIPKSSKGVGYSCLSLDLRRAQGTLNTS